MSQNKVSLNEAVFKSLDELKTPVTFQEILKNISDKEYWSTTAASQLPLQLRSNLGTLIDKGDTRVNRLKNDNGKWVYYLTKNEQTIELVDTNTATEKEKYNEGDLHKLLSTYLKSKDISSKTIVHGKSNREDNAKKWIHPDMIGISFQELQNKASKSLIKTINPINTFTLYSYELKKEINYDYDLKPMYFQAVSNSSWANYGYLVAFEIDSRLKPEMERLNKAFGIGIIELNSNPFQSKVWFEAKYKKLDFTTIDKLCINSDFAIFIEKLGNLLKAEDIHYDAIKKDFEEICDEYFKAEAEAEEEIKKYCDSKGIPQKDASGF
jgi:hypothetical protein